jgi:glutathione S-transferase
MKLFYAPGACSLADHIALNEAGLPFELERVDLKRKTTESGTDFNVINPKGYVPALLLDSGDIITENVAVLDWIAMQAPALALAGPLGRTRLIETLVYISTEIHKNFKPYFAGAVDDEKARAQALLTRRLQLLADQLTSDYLFGHEPTVADFYLLVMLLWAGKFHIVLPKKLESFRERALSRPAVVAAMKTEGWVYPVAT